MKVLVVFGSKRGGTAGLAQMIGEEFRRHGVTAEVRDAVTDAPIEADLVVVGGALYMNRWHRAARQFVRSHHRQLIDMPVWLFSSGPLDATARAGDIAPVPQVQALAAQVEAHGHMTFGGRLEPDAKGFIARSMAKKYAGDWRDPEQVAEWVRRILHDLVSVEAVVPAVTVPAQRAPAAGAHVAALPAQRTQAKATSDS